MNLGKAVFDIRLLLCVLFRCTRFKIQLVTVCPGALLCILPVHSNGD